MFSTDHVDIVKPPDRSHPRYTRFVSALRKEVSGIAPNSKPKKVHVQLLNTPCTMKEGTYYPNVRDMPGGPKLQRPVFELENVGSFSIWYPEGDKYLLLLEFALTNRGEESIVKDWELCLEKDRKPVMYVPAEVPEQGILANGEKITNDMTLTETAVRTPIPHGRRVVGWVCFSVPKEIAEECIKSKLLPPGSFRFKDYLAHTYSYDFTPDTSGGDINVYVPGKGSK